MKKTVEEIIKNIMAFHSGLSQYYYSLIENAKDQRAILLLDYLGRHEDYVSKHLEKYLHDSKDKILKQWIKVVPWLPSNIFCHCSKNFDIVAPVSTDDVIEMAIHYEDCLIDFFTVLVKEAESTKAKTMFENFFSQAKTEEKKFANNALRIYDI